MEFSVTVLRTLRSGAMLIVLALSAGSLFSNAQSQPAADNAMSATPAGNGPSRVVPYRYRTTQLPRKAQQYYSLVWGVDSLSVKAVESGEIIRFSYRVLDPNRASVLNDKKKDPSLIDPRAGVRLMVPSLEKVGQLRQSSTPEAGKVYWMAFSNKGRPV